MWTNNLRALAESAPESLDFYVSTTPASSDDLAIFSESRTLVSPVVPYNVFAGTTAVVQAGDDITSPVMIYGATDDDAGGVLNLRSGGAVGGSISFFGAGGEFDDASGDANAYHFYGGGGIIRLSGPGASATVENTDGQWDSIYGAGIAVKLVNAETNVVGDNNLVTFASGATGAVSLYGSATQWNTVAGSNGVAILNGGCASFVGGGDTIYATPGAWMSLYATNGAADIVNASSDFLILNGVEAQVTGGGDAILTTSPSTVSLSGQDGAWSGVYGSSDAISLSGGAAAILGGDETIAATPGSWMSLFNTAGQADAVQASGANVIVNGAQAAIVGGGNDVWTNGAVTVSLSQTAGAWDALWGSGAQVTVTGAQASIFGDSNVVAASNAALSLYATGSQGDSVAGANNVIALVGADAVLQGGGNDVYFDGDCALAVNGQANGFYFGPTFGAVTISGFDPTDVVHLSAADWADFGALQASGDLVQSGSDVMILLGSHDAITLTNVQASALSATQFAFA